MGEEFVISGISGKFPLSDNMNIFRENLFNKVDMVTSSKRWELHNPELPKRMGKVNNIEKLDAGFFGIHKREVDLMEPMYRGLMEKVFEAVYDAGVNPKELEGSRTGIYIAVNNSDYQGQMLIQDLRQDSFTFMGLARAVLPNRISYTLKVNGPSTVIDTGCSSSLIALNEAYGDLRTGKIEAAIVGAAVVHLHPMITLQFAKIGVVSLDGASKSFDDSANGFARSEAIAAILLQKSKHARRVYSKIVHCRASSDGYKDTGISHTSTDEQSKQMSDLYKECKINPTSIGYVETHGTGTIVGDFQEIHALSETFCKNRTTPLLIGSVKSNMGHAEPAAALCQIAKATIIMENGLIPPNLHFKTPRKGMKALEDGTIEVVCEAKPFSSGLIAISAYGIGGSNAHAALKWNEKAKSGGGEQKDEVLRLVCVSGRVKESTEAILKQLVSLDVEYEALLHQVFKYDIPQHSYRGFAIVGNSGIIYKSVKMENLRKIPDFCLSFGNPHKMSAKYLSEVLELSIAREIFQRIELALAQKYLNSSKELSTNLATVSVQIIVIEILKLCKLTPKLIRGVGYGKFVESFALGLLSLEETISAVYFESVSRNKITNQQDVTDELNGVTIHLPSHKEIIFDQNHHENFLFSFLKAIGRLYELGYNPQVFEIYPKVNFPVSRGTSMISPLIQWNHRDDYFVPSYTETTQKTVSFEKVFAIDVKDNEWEFIVDHVIDGDKRNLFPGAGYIYIVWQAFAAMKEKLPEEIEVILENVRFVRATSVPKSGTLEFFVSIRKGSGCFEVLESKACVATGRIINGNSDYNVTDITTKEPLTQNIVQEKDIYKDLRVRGYRYSGLFRSIKSCTSDFSCAEVQWHNNWTTFIDNMLQLKILHLPRVMCVGTFIQQITINAGYHLKFANKQRGLLIPVYYQKTPEIIKSGGIKIAGVTVSAISRRKPFKKPVLEKYVFVPSEGVFSLEDAVRISVQLILENTFKLKVKFAEFEQDDIQALTPLILKALSYQTLIQAESFMVQCNRKAKVDDCLFVVGSKLLQNINLINSFVATENFVLSREDLNYKFDDKRMEILSVYKTPTETLVLLRKRLAWKLPKIVQLQGLQWIQELQDLKQNETEILVVSQSDPFNGILGFVNCIYKEPGGQCIKCLFIQDNTAPVVDLNVEFYQKQLRKGLAINVFKNGLWGTYRYLPLEQELVAEKQHAVVDVLSKGNLSSLKWVEGPLTTEEGCVRVCYAALNYKDVMSACGRIQYTTSSGLHEKDLLLGLEYSGSDANGKRVMGILTEGALSNRVKPDKDLLLPVPDEWSLEEAATVPFVYLTALYALVKVANIKKGQSILIHAGAGGVGQAAINIASHFGLKIYTTVGAEQKRAFLLSNYPSLNKHRISNSRNTDFEQMVMRETRGRGVDVVLNSLTEEKLEASLRCLAKQGKFLEIESSDLLNNNDLCLEFFKRGVSFHSINLEKIMHSDSESKKRLIGLLKTAIEEGVVKPLPRSLFETDKIEEAFRFMESSCHIGKVVIKINEYGDISKSITATKRYYCIPESCCIVTGGLGGVGLELVDWLIKRGGRKFVLSSRSGVNNSYQATRIKLTWVDNGIEIQISTQNIATKAGCKKLLEEANLLGPVTSIFHLAVVLSMALFEDQTEYSFNVCLDPKAKAVEHLDVLSRDLCPNLRDFVVFSSLLCGRGGAGQTSYGMANSVAERITEQRKQLGLPALAIQWGMIEDVGLAAEMHSRSSPLEAFGTQQQSLSSCFEVLDRFLKDTDLAVVSSVVMAEQKSVSGRADNIVEAVANIIGVRDLKTISMCATLPELGMDSLLATEIKQVLERDFEISFTRKEVRNLTFAKLHEIMMKKSADELQATESTRANINLETHKELRKPSSVQENGKIGSVYLLSEVEGVVESLVKGLSFHCVRLPFRREGFKEADATKTALGLLNLIEDEILKVGTFDIIAASFGCVVALEIALHLEKKGVQGRVIFIQDVPKITANLFEQTELSQPSTKKPNGNLLFPLFQCKDNNNNYKKFASICSKMVLCTPNQQGLAEASEENSFSKFTNRIKVCGYDEKNFNADLFKVITGELC